MIQRAMADAPPEPFLAVGAPMSAVPPPIASFSEPPPAGFWRRALAVGLDFFFIVFCLFVANAAIRVVWGNAGHDARVFRAASTAFMIAFPLLYAVLFHWLWGQTMGKMIVGARVVARDGGPLSGRRAVLRMLGWVLSALILGLGFLVPALRRDKRSLADLVAGTRVERI
jgi:uncharacterized RDD family membrane protein YckC